MRGKKAAEHQRDDTDRRLLYGAKIAYWLDVFINIKTCCYPTASQQLATDSPVHLSPHSTADFPATETFKHLTYQCGGELPLGIILYFAAQLYRENSHFARL